LDKLRLRHNKRRRQRAVLRHPRIQLPQRSNRLRRDSSLRLICRRGSNPLRICHRGSNRRRPQENLVRQDNLQPQANLQRQEQSAQRVLLQPLRRAPLPLSHPLRKSLLVF
jgi:hypothetical protein